MPSLRVLSVILLVGMGATVAAVGGGAEPGQSDAEVRGSLLASVPGTSVTDGRTGASDAGAADATAGAGPGSGTSTTSQTAFDVRVENRKPGTPGWRISRARGTHPGLAGYTGALSVLPGQSVPLSISAAGPVKVRALRIGWYDGVGARQIWQGTVQAQLESGDPTSWRPRGRADTSGWPEGHYLLRLDQGEASRYLPLTVRSPDIRRRLVVLTSPLTWQAENTFGASGTASTPTSTTGSGSGSVRTADLPKISFDRPYASGYGSAGFLQHDSGIVQLAERSGRRIGYATDHDAATDPGLLTKAAAVLVGGDSRYWTASLRTSVRAAEDAGTNVAFFGAGTGSRRIRLINDGRALQVSLARPSASVRLTGQRPSCPVATSTKTTETMETGTNSESTTSSGTTTSSGSTAAGWVVSNADWWGYEGTGVQTDDVLPGLVFEGVDRVATSASDSPKPMQVLAYTRFRCGTRVDGSEVASQPRSVAHSGVYLVRRSGAGVFASGTSRWACAVVNECTDASGKAVQLDGRTQRVASRVTLNVIKAFAKDQAGQRFEAKNTAVQYAALR